MQQVRCQKHGWEFERRLKDHEVSGSPFKLYATKSYGCGAWKLTSIRKVNDGGARKHDSKRLLQMPMKTGQILQYLAYFLATIDYPVKLSLGSRTGEATVCQF